MAKTIIITCTECDGTGELDARDHYRGRYYNIKVRCYHCRGIGERVVEAEAETERAA